MKRTRQTRNLNYKSEPSIRTIQLPNEDEIRHRAHQLFMERGGAPGKELDDWLQAERELKSRIEGTGSAR